MAIISKVLSTYWVELKAKINLPKDQWWYLEITKAMSGEEQRPVASRTQNSGLDGPGVLFPGETLPGEGRVLTCVKCKCFKCPSTVFINERKWIIKQKPHQKWLVLMVG